MNGASPKTVQPMPKKKNHGRYEETRRRFDELEVEEQASFLVEAATTTVARGLMQAGEVLADGLEDFVRRARTRSTVGDEGRSPGAAEPETSQSHSPKNQSPPPKDEK